MSVNISAKDLMSNQLVREVGRGARRGRASTRGR